MQHVERARSKWTEMTSDRGVHRGQGSQSESDKARENRRRLKRSECEHESVVVFAGMCRVDLRVRLTKDILGEWGGVVVVEMS